MLTHSYPGNFYMLPAMESTFLDWMDLYPRILGRKRVIHKPWKGNVFLYFSTEKSTSTRSSSDSWGKSLVFLYFDSLISRMEV
jgi:hypothetical protein